MRLRHVHDCACDRQVCERALPTDLTNTSGTSTSPKSNSSQRLSKRRRVSSEHDVCIVNLQIEHVNSSSSLQDPMLQTKHWLPVKLKLRPPGALAKVYKFFKTTMSASTLGKASKSISFPSCRFWFSAF